jgi:hypothetical protein
MTPPIRLSGKNCSTNPIRPRPIAGSVKTTGRRVIARWLSPQGEQEVAELVGKVIKSDCAKPGEQASDCGCGEHPAA